MKEAKLGCTALIDVSGSMYKGRGFFGWGTAKKDLAIVALEKLMEQFPEADGISWTFVLFDKEAVVLDDLSEVKEYMRQKPRGGSAIFTHVHNQLESLRFPTMRGIPQMLVVLTDCIDNRSPLFLQNKYKETLADLVTVLICLGPSEGGKLLPHNSFFFFGDNRDDDDDDLDKFGQRVSDFLKAHHHFVSHFTDSEDDDKPHFEQTPHRVVHHQPLRKGDGPQGNIFTFSHLTPEGGGGKKESEQQQLILNNGGVRKRQK